MNKQELIKKYKKLEGVWDAPGAETARQIFLQDLDQLDEPQKVVVPQFVAQYIEWTKGEDFHLLGAMSRGNFDKTLEDWFYTDDNMELFARAWLDGYEVEKEKRFRVKVKGICGNHETLNCEKHSGKWLFSDREENTLYKTNHTRKELEEAGFGWVFDCEGIEIKEADWYEEHKDNLEYNIWDWMKYNLEPKKRENVIFSQWLGKTVNNPVETLIKMKLNGYEVEKEKRYSVKIRGKIEENLLVYGLGINRYFFARTYDSTKRNEHTREQLEEAGFGWVFDCEGIEIKEVE